MKTEFDCTLCLIWYGTHPLQCHIHTNEAKHNIYVQPKRAPCNKLHLQVGGQRRRETRQILWDFHSCMNLVVHSRGCLWRKKANMLSFQLTIRHETIKTRWLWRSPTKTVEWLHIRICEYLPQGWYLHNIFSFRWLGPLQIFHMCMCPPIHFFRMQEQFWANDGWKVNWNGKETSRQSGKARWDARLLFLEVPNPPLPINLQSFVDLFG